MKKILAVRGERAASILAILKQVATDDARFPLHEIHLETLKALAEHLFQTTFDPDAPEVPISRAGEVVGEGYHPKAGEPHAEVFALRAAGDAARGATAYVSLEPCDHFGRTPPCSRALVDAGVKRVVVGFVDPDPRVSGGGIRTLLDAGVEVVVGCEEEACREINREFIERNT